MITRLRAQNFKSWKDTGDLRIAPLTGLFGTNSSGKTSILQALLVLKQTVDSPDPNRLLSFGDERSALDLGTFVDVIHGHRIDLQLRFSLYWRAGAHDGHLEVAFYEAGDRLHLADGKCVLDGDSLTAREGPEGLLLSRNGGPEGGIPFLWPYFVFRPGNPSVRDAIRNIHYLGPLRLRPRRAPYVWSGNDPWGVGADGGEFAQALVVPVSGASTARSVGESLRRLKLIESFRIERVASERRDYEIRLRKAESGPEVLLPDVGFGVSQVLPVLVLCYYAAEGSTLVIEQPELHLHPAAQSELADVLIDVVKNRSMQIILESHSEHLLRRLQRRIAEGAFAANDAALYFCEMDNGASKCTPLEITDEGFIRNWPKDFFGDEMGELAATTEAAMKHRLSRAK